jgi:hypothetical protein
MRLEAHLTTGDLQDVIFQLAPMAISLDPGSPQRRLEIKPPSVLELREGEGLRIVTDLQLQWDVIGVRFPVTVRRVALLLSPSIEWVDGQPAMLFAIRVEDADVSALPGFLGEVLVARVNDALSRPESRIVWRFLETLDFRFPLPAQVQPAYAARLFARSAEVQVKNHSLRLSVEWAFTAEAGPERPRSARD